MLGKIRNFCMVSLYGNLKKPILPLKIIIPTLLKILEVEFLSLALWSRNNNFLALLSAQLLLWSLLSKVCKLKTVVGG